MTPHDAKHLDSLLADLRRRDDADTPSPRVVRTVLDHCAAQASTAPVASSTLVAPARASRPVAWRAAAAACGLSAAAAWWLFAALPDQSVRLRTGAAPIDDAAPSIAGRPPASTPAPGSDAVDSRGPAAPPLATGPDRTVDDDGAMSPSFVALSPIAGDAGVVRLMRVQLPETAVRALGFDVPAPFVPPDGFVEADVLLGEDGMARAIRIIP